MLLCTTTKIFPFPALPCATTAEALDSREHRLLCAGTPVPGTEKLSAPPVAIAELATWFDYVLVEDDGSAQRPFKAHAAHEPVIPAEANQVICVVGVSGFGRPVAEIAHRPELYARLAGVSVEDTVTPEIETAVLRAESLHQRIYVNQVETQRDLAAAKALAALLDCQVLAGSLHRKEYFVCL